MIGSLEKKPENGGMPTSASPPTRKATYVFGISLPRPPILRMSCSSIERVDDDAGGEEQERLEERVREQVEHPARVRADPDGDEHVADLGHRRVGDHALDVGLDERDEAGEDERDGAERRGRVLHRARELEERRRARDQVDAGGHHRRRVDQGADRRRAFHRVRQPRVERELRRLGDRAAEQAERDQDQHRLGQARRLREHARCSRACPSARSAGRGRARRWRRRPRSSRTPSWPPRPRSAARARSRSGGRTRGRRGPSPRAAGAGSRPRRAAASRTRTWPCRRSSAAPRRRRACSRSSRGRSARRRRRRSAS